jgi:hypothetical protein
MDKRCTSADRDAVADELSLHYQAGSLNLEEFNTRLDKAMSAILESDLNGLSLDLPELPGRQMPQPQTQAVQRKPYAPRSRSETWVVQNWLAIGVSIAIVTVSSILFHGTGDGGYAYLMIVLLCGLVNGFLGFRKNRSLAIIGFLTGLLAFVGTALIIALTWRRKIKAS